MKKRALLWRLVMIELLFVLIWPAHGTVLAETSLLEQLQQANQSGLIVRTHSETGAITSLRMPDTSIEVPQLRRFSGADASVIGLTFLRTYGALFGLGHTTDGVREIQREQVPAGGTMLKYQQLYQGVPIVAGEIVVAVTAQRRIRNVHAEVLPIETNAIDTRPRISRQDAQYTALVLVQRRRQASTDQLVVSEPSLWIFNPKLLGGPQLPQTTLNWRMEVTGTSEDGRPVREFVLVNAHTGTVTIHFSQIAHALSQRICDNNSALDADGNPDNNCASDKQAIRTNSPTDTGKADVDIAWEFTKATYDYYKTVLNRDSIDNKGMQLISLVNYCVPGLGGCPYENAFWDGVMMTYGATFANADDVVAHELTHGVTERTAGLFYYFQSGAINEALSDIFGELVDRAHDGRSVDASDTPWLMGEDLSIGAIRDMQDPPAFGQPDKMSATDYTADANMDDSGGVHTNSGVANKAAYLLIVGDTFNGQTVSAIGDTKTAALFYGTMTQYLTSGSDYADLADALATVCAGYALDGVFSFTSSDCNQVNKAILATEMTTSPQNAPAPEAAMCSDINVPLVSWSESFNDGKFSSWKSAPAKIWTSFEGYAPDGSKVLYGINQAKAGSATIQLKAPILIPEQAFLHLQHYYLFEYDDSASYDGGLIEYSSDGKNWTDAGPLITTNGYSQILHVGSDNPMGGSLAFGGTSNGYMSSRLDVSTLAGQKLYFRFRIVTDAAVGYDGWLIDNLKLYQCVDPYTNIVQLAGSGNHTCATTIGNRVLCWGQGDAGQIGNGTLLDAPSATFVLDSSYLAVASVVPPSAGGEFGCAIRTTKRVACWGANASGQLGINTLVTSETAATVLIDATTPLTNVVGLATGSQHACAVRADSSVYCWGENGAGQVGNNTETDQKVAVPVQKSGGIALTGVTQVVAGADHTCALVRDGSVWCWGDNGSGELGVGATPLKSAVALPTKVSATKMLTGIRTVATGADVSCAMTTKAALLCWGRNTEGQMGNGTYTNVLFPTAPKIGKKALTNVTQIAMGLGSHLCAIDTSKNIYCWGANANGQLGLNSTEAKNAPTMMNATVKSTLGTVVKITTGLTHTCALNAQLAVYCWGDNSNGQLGDDSGVDSSLLPVRVSVLTEM